MARIMGIDYGVKRIGIAFSDETGVIAMPHSVLTVQNVNHGVAEVVRVFRERNPEKVVVGLPLNMNGTRGPLVDAVMQFVDRLKGELTVPIVTWDERLSSKLVERMLIDSDVRRSKRKGVVDKLAAQVVLQSYLDVQSLPPFPPLAGRPDEDPEQ